MKKLFDCGDDVKLKSEKVYRSVNDYFTLSDELTEGEIYKVKKVIYNKFLGTYLLLLKGKNYYQRQEKFLNAEIRKPIYTKRYW